MTWKRSSMVTAGFLLALTAAAGQAASKRPQSNLQIELAKLAQDIKLLLDERREDAIVVGPFRGVDNMSLSSSGSLLRNGLSKQLTQLGVQVKLRGTRLTVLGKYRGVEDKHSGRTAIELTVTFENNTGASEGDLTRRLGDPRGLFVDENTLIVLSGGTVSLPPKNSASRKDRLRKGIDEPEAHVEGSIIRAKDAPYAIEVLTHRNQERAAGSVYSPQRAENREGFAFVPIQREEVYAIRLINDTEHEAAVRLTIDGLSVFAFSELRDDRTGAPKFERLLVKPRSSVTIEGWYINNHASDQFVVTEYARSAAAQLASSASVGTITAIFAAAWPKEDRPPADEPSTRTPKDATGRGVRIGSRYAVVERAFGVARAAVSVRYTK